MGRKSNNQKSIEGIIALVIIGGIITIIKSIFEVIISIFQEIIQLFNLLFSSKYWVNGLIPTVIILLGISIIWLIVQIKIRKKRLYIEKQRIYAEKIRIDNERNRKALEEYDRKLKQVMISDNRNDYTIQNEDYKRGNKKENEYRKKYLLPLLKIYNNQCAKCGKSSNGFDLDHFIISKNEGGNFVLVHKDGYLVNNAIPLCQSCNRSKGDKSYKTFFSDEELLVLFTKNKEMTLLIN